MAQILAVAVSLVANLGDLYLTARSRLQALEQVLVGTQNADLQDGL